MSTSLLVMHTILKDYCVIKLNGHSKKREEEIRIETHRMKRYSKLL